MTEADHEGRRLRIVQVDADLVLRILKFPENAKAVRAFIQQDRNGCIVNFVLEHPDFPPVPEGHVIGEVSPIFSIDGFKGWGNL